MSTCHNHGPVDLLEMKSHILCFEDIVKEVPGFAVVRNAGGLCAARLRVSEKNFVADHAQSLGYVFFTALAQQKVSQVSCVPQSCGKFRTP